MIELIKSQRIYAELDERELIHWYTKKRRDPSKHEQVKLE